MQTRKLRILYVDDNDDICFIILTLLKRAGYTAVTADSIHGALWLAQRESFDLHIMEKMLPDGSGLDLWVFPNKRSICFIGFQLRAS